MVSQNNGTLYLKRKVLVETRDPRAARRGLTGLNWSEILKILMVLVRS